MDLGYPGWDLQLLTGMRLLEACRCSTIAGGNAVRNFCSGAFSVGAAPPTGTCSAHNTAPTANHCSAIGVGGTKMKIHKAAIRSLFRANDLVLDAAEIYELGKSL